MIREIPLTDETVRQHGFDSLAEFHRLVATYRMQTDRDRGRFKDWQMGDGSKAGLLAIIADQNDGHVPPGQASEYKHAEAYCLMRYKCRSCGTVETIWNARDGVTPFMVACTVCPNGMMEHIDWKSDRCEPDHCPDKGDRVFVDSTDLICRIYWRMVVERCWETGPTPMRDQFKTKAEAVEALNDYSAGRPYLLTVT